MDGRFFAANQNGEIRIFDKIQKKHISLNVSLNDGSKSALIDFKPNRPTCSDGSLDRRFDINKNDIIASGLIEMN